VSKCQSIRVSGWTDAGRRDRGKKDEGRRTKEERRGRTCNVLCVMCKDEIASPRRFAPQSGAAGVAMTGGRKG